MTAGAAGVEGEEGEETGFTIVIVKYYMYVNRKSRSLLPHFA
jgi:hypothetical protein